jgi:phage tail protein X
MNDEDLRDCFAMFAMMGLVSRGIDGDMVDTVSHNAYVMADAMLEARKPKEEGLIAIKRKVKTK